MGSGIAVGFLGVAGPSAMPAILFHVHHSVRWWPALGSPGSTIFAKLC